VAGALHTVRFGEVSGLSSFNIFKIVQLGAEKLHIVCRGILFCATLYSSVISGQHCLRNNL